MSNKRIELQTKISENEIYNDFLYEYIISNNINYTSNKNGIFVNLTELNNDVIDEMYDYIIKMTFNIQSHESSVEINNKKNIIRKKNIIDEIVYKPLPKLKPYQIELIELSKTI